MTDRNWVSWDICTVSTAEANHPLHSDALSLQLQVWAGTWVYSVGAITHRFQKKCCYFLLAPTDRNWLSWDSCIVLLRQTTHYDDALSIITIVTGFSWYLSIFSWWNYTQVSYEVLLVFVVFPGANFSRMHWEMHEWLKLCICRQAHCISRAVGDAEQDSG